jgi:hypothetical protein
MTFDQLYFISHQPGTVGDSLTAFLSMHTKSASFNIVGNRMRTASSGILLNWAYYYKNWPSQQADPNLHKHIDIQPGVANFAQAHFFLQEHQLFDKFPGCKSIRLLVKDPANQEIYFKRLYHKHMNKKMHRAWHDRYLKFARLRNHKTQAALLDMCNNRTLKIKHYWSAWYIDNLGLDLNLVPEPFEYWLSRRNIVDFHPNLATQHANNLIAQNESPHPQLISVYIDQLWPLHSTDINIEVYQHLCDQIGITPNLELARNFWQWWLPEQPDPEQILIDPTWI